MENCGTATEELNDLHLPEVEGPLPAGCKSIRKPGSTETQISITRLHGPAAACLCTYTNHVLLLSIDTPTFKIPKHEIYSNASTHTSGHSDHPR